MPLDYLLPIDPYSWEWYDKKRIDNENAIIKSRTALGENLPFDQYKKEVEKLAKCRNNLQRLKLKFDVAFPEKHNIFTNTD